MPEELQSLLERIHKDGVEKAEDEASKIVEAAQAKAAEITVEAEKNAEELRQQAQKDADVQAERGRRALEQAARDVVLTVGSAVDNLLGSLVRTKVAGELTDDTLRDIIVSVVETYAKAGPEGARLDVLLPEERGDEFGKSVLAVLSRELAKGVEVRGDGSVISGFRISMENDRIEHDFTGDAIAEALCQLVRPHLGEIVKDSLGAGKSMEDEA